MIKIRKRFVDDKEKQVKLAKRRKIDYKCVVINADEVLELKKLFPTIREKMELAESDNDDIEDVSNFEANISMPKFYETINLN